ncbi:hypothetical protein F0231_15035 [Vibrio sp. RE86]|uniref:hypothetical protein n=1 Tax=Vibrio sp. RE86 TaxID=2607605 RepID=UPI00149354E4|nr:hypothetical protein [Vibrio sp. RE86]NOH81058.1 hypothetical protein [Vibrio sp. RE86]
MRTSQIIMPKAENSADGKASKLVKAYMQERTLQEVTEVELNRSKIMVMDESGKMKLVPIIKEH